MAQHPYAVQMHSEELLPQKPGARRSQCPCMGVLKHWAQTCPGLLRDILLHTHTHTHSHVCTENHLAHRLNDTAQCLLMAAGATQQLLV